MNFKEFLAYVEKECIKHNVEFIKGDKYVVYPGTDQKGNGFFDENRGGDRPIMAAALNLEESVAFPLLAHEFNHMQQFFYDKKTWNAPILSSLEMKKHGYSKDKAVDSYILMDDWINNKIQLNDIEKVDMINRCILLEWDCENRTLQMINDLNLEIEKDYYVKTANSYLYFYQFVALEKRWYDIGKAPYQIKEIYENMPVNFQDLNLLKPMTKEWHNIYLKYL